MKGEKNVRGESEKASLSTVFHSLLLLAMMMERTRWKEIKENGSSKKKEGEERRFQSLMHITGTQRDRVWAERLEGESLTEFLCV